MPGSVPTTWNSIPTAPPDPRPRRLVEPCSGERSSLQRERHDDDLLLRRSTKGLGEQPFHCFGPGVEETSRAGEVLHAQGPVGEYPIHGAGAEQRYARGSAADGEDGAGLAAEGFGGGHVDQHWVFRFLRNGVYGCHCGSGVRSLYSDVGLPEKMNNFMVFECHGAFAPVDHDWFH